MERLLFHLEQSPQMLTVAKIRISCQFLQKSYKFATFNGTFSSFAALVTTSITDACASQMAE